MEESNLTLYPAHNYANDPDGMKTFRLSDLEETNRPIYATKKRRKTREAQSSKDGTARAPDVQRVVAGPSSGRDEATNPIVDLHHTANFDYLEPPGHQPCHFTSCLYPHSNHTHAWRFNDHVLQRRTVDFCFNYGVGDDAGNYIDPRYLELSDNSQPHAQPSRNTTLDPEPNIAASVSGFNSLSERSHHDGAFEPTELMVSSPPYDHCSSTPRDDGELPDQGLGTDKQPT